MRTYIFRFFTVGFLNQEDLFGCYVSHGLSFIDAFGQAL